VSRDAWFCDREAWRLIALRYLPAMAALNLGWEALQAPLYTLWDEARAAYIVFSIVHCTLGDLLIGAAALGLSLIVLRERAPAGWRWRALGALTALLGLTYTVFSEWMNIALLRTWSYSERMPTLTLGELTLGLAPLLQWVFLPPMAVCVARRAARRARGE
jgi:hypothetical protein